MNEPLTKNKQAQYLNPKGTKKYLFIKRFLDITLSLIGIIVLLPVFLIVAVFYSFGKNKGPVFFKQQRVGLRGDIFYIYKFRSMIVDAEDVLKSNKKLYEKYVKNSYKLHPEEDPRITKMGNFLRKTSLDELPQLFNVFKGEMSLVGPRPVVKEELKEYEPHVNEFLSVKPGVTGYWQICGRSDVNYPERAHLELHYINNKSLVFDTQIIFKTLLLVITRKGAY